MKKKLRPIDLFYKPKFLSRNLVKIPFNFLWRVHVNCLNRKKEKRRYYDTYSINNICNITIFYAHV